MPENDPPAAARPPLVLIANDQEWSARSLESILAPSGYAVLRAYTGRQALELARTTHPDAVILDERMPDIRGSDICRTLRDDPRFSAQVPLVLLTSDAVNRDEALAAYGAGAWEYLSQPCDAEALLLRLGTYIRAKREVDRVRDDSLLDAATGLYNMRGLARRAREIGAEAYRQHGALACVALSADDAEAAGNYYDRGMDELLEQMVVHLGRTARRIGRASDVIGRLGRTELAIIAPSTESAGAQRLVERLQEAMGDAPLALSGGGAQRPVRIRAGYYAVADYSDSSVDAVEMLLRAATALRHLRSEGEKGGRIRSFDEVPVRFVQ